jgi:hypothetical protein
MNEGAASETGNDKMEGDMSSEESSDSDDSDFELDASSEDIAAITKLETDVGANPNLYDLHLQVLRHTPLPVLLDNSLLKTCIQICYKFLGRCKSETSCQWV